MKFNRASGVLLHPTSLPGDYGIGDLGPQAYRWLDYLVEAGCYLWQVLPLGPTGYGDSPYQSFSAFAGNPYLISPDLLVSEGLLEPVDLDNRPVFPRAEVDFGSIIPWKLAVLDRAFKRFQASASQEFRSEMEKFQTENAAWLDDFALFMALKEANESVSWVNWPLPLRMRESQALSKARQELAYAVQRQIFQQFIFFRQWANLHNYAKLNGIQIIGDIPIFVAHDSADVWSHPELFFLDRRGEPTVVAGVPPDYFSPTGQLWGNPLYRWEEHASSEYAWWLERFRSVLRMVDIVRLDHFRGFCGYWEVPGGNLTAEIGRWVPGPGKKFLQVIQDGLGELPIIAEDLGVITPDVIELRDRFGLPGMRIFQFAFQTDPDDRFLPHNYTRNTVAYTGTHDNDTILGWFATAPKEERRFCLRYLGVKEEDLVWSMIRAVWGSIAMFSLAPLHDLLELGPEARMNFPGRPSGNWGWRMAEEDLTDSLRGRLQELNYLYSRKKPKEENLRPDQGQISP